MIYEIAGLRIDIQNKCVFTTKFCAAYLSEDQTSPVHFSVAVSQEEFEKERALSPNFSDGYIENICLYRNLCLLVPQYDRFLLHSCVVNCEGDGYAFLGKSGTGKSTHSALWLKYLPQTYIVNGDKPLLAVEKDTVYAYGTPWMGKERRGVNERVPLKGLCFLRQAKENKIKRLTPAETAALLFGQILLPTDEANAVKTLELADTLIQTVPAYLLDCDMSQDAVKTSYEGLTKKIFEKGEIR